MGLHVPGTVVVRNSPSENAGGCRKPALSDSQHPVRSGGCHTSIRQRVIVPPSTTMVWPVTKFAASEARKTAAPTRSDGSISRWTL